MSFAIEPQPERRQRVACVEGIVRHVDEERLHIGTPGFRTEHALVAYHLPASLDLRPLVGRKVRVEIADAKTLTIVGDTGRLWLVAHRGRDAFWQSIGGFDLCATLSKDAFWQSIGGFDLCATLSKDAEEMLVIGPRGQHHVLRRGESARIAWGSRAWVVELVAYDAPGEGAYFIADACLWH